MRRGIARAAAVLVSPSCGESFCGRTAEGARVARSDFGINFTSPKFDPSTTAAKRTPSNFGCPPKVGKNRSRKRED